MSKNENYTPAQVVAARNKMGHTQTAAGEMIYRTQRCWQCWELGTRAIDRGLFELYLFKTGQYK
jgi:hypothetical protein